MPSRSDLSTAATGTRFRIFVLPPYAGAAFAQEPETIFVSVPPSLMQFGPGDARFNVIDAEDKQPYDDTIQPPTRPPFLGPVAAPVRPGPDGHFDHILTDSREFLAATMYATVRRTLDIWESYFGHPVIFPFALNFPRMELIPAVNWDNAQSGYGFLEFGYASDGNGPDLTRPYCENFDVLAHEMGHTIVYGTLGYPTTPMAKSVEYGGFHESAADLVALVAALHFETLLDHLLASSRGNLFTVNELSRVGETALNEQIRLAFNYERMSTVSPEPHDLSQPLTGALFDVLVEVFQKKLLARGLISPALAAQAMGPEGGKPDTKAVNFAFAIAYHDHESAFKAVLIEARDYFGALLAGTWSRLTPDHLSYVKVGLATLATDQVLTGGLYQETIRACFAWREITFPLDHDARQVRFVQPVPPPPVPGKSPRPKPRPAKRRR